MNDVQAVLVAGLLGGALGGSAAGAALWLMLRPLLRALEASLEEPDATRYRAALALRRLIKRIHVGRFGGTRGLEEALEAIALELAEEAPLEGEPR